ncbi:hypothetical protein GOZ83_20005 [Agrobacterium vitis]|uniref:hypothetical protein n=1 Tax=Agrobacterium vitis TaxID=373 RepID=UPI0012E9241A|nr:hypothetical protein [Agrobacterium vitis]MVA47342.1 hypothetical protein [Agrobacterium vitis]
MATVVEDLSPLAKLDLCRSHADKAAWLLTEPQAVLLRLQIQVGFNFLHCGFGDGITALSAHVAALHAPRLADGDLPATVVARLEFEKSRMREIVRIGGRV